MAVDPPRVKADIGASVGCDGGSTFRPGNRYAHCCHPGQGLLEPASRKLSWAGLEVRRAQSSQSSSSLGWKLQGQDWAKPFCHQAYLGPLG